MARAGARHLNESWSRVNEVFHRVLAEPAEKRQAILDNACAGDAELRREVESLLAAHDRAGGLLDEAAEVSHSLRDASASEALIGQSLGRYTIRRVLGQGGMGVVYLADDASLGRPVALKVLTPRLTEDAKASERLRREARAAAALSHPNIATVFALEEIDGRLYLATEYVPGLTLREELSRGPLPIARVIDSAVALAGALAAAHERGIIHRDLKPENVIRAPTGQLKILDFGIARFVDAPDGGHASLAAPLTGEGFVLGTPAYMSPEQIRAQSVDARSDIFSLGILVYELLTGAHPFAGKDTASTIARILESEPPPIPSIAVDTANDSAMRHGLAEIIRVCLAKAPDDRYRSAAELVAALEALRRGEAVSRRRDKGAAMWWWQFHQAATSITYAALLYPMWIVHHWIAGVRGQLFFLGALVAVLVSVTLRLHLWFTVRSYPSEWPTQRRSTLLWIRIADAALVALLFMATVFSLEHAHMSTLMVCLAVAVLLSFAIIEPATERAAFRNPPASSDR